MFKLMTIEQPSLEFHQLYSEPLTAAQLELVNRTTIEARHNGFMERYLGALGTSQDVYREYIEAGDKLSGNFADCIVSIERLKYAELPIIFRFNSLHTTKFLEVRKVNHLGESFFDSAMSIGDIKSVEIGKPPIILQDYEETFTVEHIAFALDRLSAQVYSGLIDKGTSQVLKRFDGVPEQIAKVA